MGLDNPRRGSIESLGSLETAATYNIPVAQVNLKSPGTKACIGHCCCWYFCMWAVLFPIILSQTMFARPWKRMPGHEIRKDIEETVQYALASIGSDATFAKIGKKYDDVEERKTFGFQSMRKSGMLMIGDQAGLRYTHEDGIKKNERYPMGSQTKFLTALLIYKVMQVQESQCPGYPQVTTCNAFKPSSKVQDYLDAWPKNGFGGTVEMKHLLSMTTGFVADVFKPGCAGELQVPSGHKEWVKWEQCMTELALSEFRFPPGTYFNFGPWHLHLAAGITMKSLGMKPTKENWVYLMEIYVYRPSGLWTTPKFPQSPALPDVSFGMEVSAYEWQKIMDTLMFSSAILDATYFFRLMKDHTSQVDKYAGDVGDPGMEADGSGSESLHGYSLRNERAEQYLVGGWHYAQGNWITCDALTSKAARDAWKDWKTYTWYEQNTMCSFPNPKQQAAAAEAGTVLPIREVHHSVGEHGSYIWMDLDTANAAAPGSQKYYGIHMMYWNWWLLVYQSLQALGFLSCCCCCASCGVGYQVNVKAMQYADMDVQIDERE